MIHSSFVSY